ncbi:hypothetical protein [Streptomyces sp. WMMB 322]|uniref:nSTAND1 domain-containing NTPase n=1 Tax=Streptomyces sp. WMMB 322 TaxID=1286821 RepID=UPI0006E28FB9|nr:hypothetical protein [Streptomyces sp. WMMB 322]SCK09567.1 WD40 repeat [Streptomyces sp. WMMB 322]
MLENTHESGDRVPEPGLFDSAADFGAALTSLKQRTGISLRQLSASSGLGFSTINGYCRGRHLPQAGVGEQFRALLHALGITAEQEQEDWLLSADRLRRAKAPDSVATNPYPGLRPYGIGDDRFFYGRAALIAELVAMATGDQAARAPVVVVGPSGAGKSSLLCAGLIPAVSDAWAPALLTPGKRPMRELVSALAPLTSEGADVLVDGPDDETGSLVGRLDSQLVPQRLLVVVDQLEEIFAPHIDEEDRDRFLASLTGLAAGGKVPRRHAVVLGLRADFYDRALHLPQLAGLLREAQFLVPPMNAEELREVITGPARAVGRDVDSAVVERLLGEIAPREAGRHHIAAHEPGALPLLAHVLHEAFALSSDAKTLALEHYSRTGGVTTAIARTADTAYEQLSHRQRQLARRLLLSLVYVSDTTADTRRRLSIDEVTAARPDIDLEDMAEVLDGFITHRLLTADTDSVEISHEALLVHWPRLRQWIDEARDHIRAHHRVADGTQSWLAHDRDPAELARGARLEAMRKLLDDDEPGKVLLNVAERDFVTTSIRAQRSRYRRLRWLAFVMTLLAVLTTAFAGMFAVSKQQAATARDEARSRQMAVTARQLAADDPAAAVQLAIAGYRLAPTSEARSAMMDLAAGGFPTRHRPAADDYPVAATSHSAKLFAAHYAGTSVVRLYKVAGSSLEPVGRVKLRAHRPHTGPADPIALSPDGKVLVTQERTDRLALWDITDPSRPTRLGAITAPRGTHDLAIAPGGEELAAVGTADDVYRWDISEPSAPKELPRISMSGNLHSVAYGPDGDVLAVGNDDAKVELWDLSKRPEPLAELSAGKGQVKTVAFSPNGRILAAGTALGRSVSVWDITDPTKPKQRKIADPQFDSWVNRATFSPDGTLLLAASSESVVRVWDTQSWTTVTDLPHPNFVSWVGFGNRNVPMTITEDGTAWSWDTRTAIPARMSGRAWRTTFASDTGQLAVFAEDAAAAWSDVKAGVRQDPDHLIPDDGDEQSVGDGDISADGSLLVHSYVGGKAAVFDLAGPGRPTRLSEFSADTDGLVQSLALSPNGRLVATGGDDTAVRLHDISDPRNPQLITELKEPTARVLGVRWQPQGDLLAVASADGKVSVYDVSDRSKVNRIAVLDAFDSEAHLAEFSPDGTILAAGGLDGVIRLWDIRDPNRPRLLGRITGPVNAVPKLAFHPDGTMLAATDSKGAVWLFDVSDPRHPTRYATFSPGIGQMNSLAFHPGGELLAATSVPGVIRLWPLDEDKLIKRTCTTVGESISKQEWRTHLPDIGYQPPC